MRVVLNNGMGETLLHIFRGVLGLAVLVLFCFGLSRNRRMVDWKLVGGGIALQVGLAFLVLKVQVVGYALEQVTLFFLRLLQFADEGAAFIFGPLVTEASFGYIFAFKVLPTIVFFASFTSVLYHLGILQRIVYGFAWVMHRTMRLSGAESMAAAANVFVGQTEAPLLIKPYLERMTRSEVLCLMSGGMATIAGAVFVAYISMLGGESVEQQVMFGKHLLTASLLSAPAAIVCAKLILPETEEIDRALKVSRQSFGVNVFDAAMHGATQGVKLAVNVGAALLVFIAFIAMMNFILEQGIGVWTGLNPIIVQATDGAFSGFSLQFIFALMFAPVAWVAGAEWGSLMAVGQLLGEKIVLNEFVAYGSLGRMISEGILTDQRSIIIATYALCGFANFASMGVQIGGISVLAPNQRENLTRLALPAVAAGTVACLMTACVAAMFLG